ncbi:MAG: hypothetical protein HYU78_15660 [Rhodocyclales bacterium]|nr:hypothetical protein [Rhodocyclales bacterium]
MTFTRSDFARLRISLVAALAMIAAGGSIAWLAAGEVRDATRARADAERQRVEFEGRLKQVRDEESEIRQKAAQFAAMRARGFIGEERRLDWVESIKEIRETRKLLDLQYEFAPQLPLDRAAMAGYSFRGSAMKMQLKLLHEGDLLDFINDLRAHARAYVRVRSCTVSRIARGAIPGDAAQLDADCQLDWITIQPAKEAP